METKPKCACLHVVYEPILNTDGTKTERWMCHECKSVFYRERNNYIKDCLRTLAKMVSQLCDDVDVCHICPSRHDCISSEKEKCSEVLINYAIEHPTPEEIK